MQRRSLFAAPVLLAAPSLIRQASAQAAPRIVTEEFMIPTGEAGIEVFLRSKRPEGAAAAPGRTLLMLHGGLFGASGDTWRRFGEPRTSDGAGVESRGSRGAESAPQRSEAPARQAESQDRSGFIQAMERVSDLTLFTRADAYYSRDPLVLLALSLIKPRRTLIYEAHSLAGGGFGGAVMALAGAGFGAAQAEAVAAAYAAKFGARPDILPMGTGDGAAVL
jgi:hypothetical protein